MAASEPLHSSLQTSSPAETAFYTWLRSHGATIADSVGLSSFETEGMGRGAIALEDIPVNLSCWEREKCIADMTTHA